MKYLVRQPKRLALFLCYVSNKVLYTDSRLHVLMISCYIGLFGFFDRMEIKAFVAWILLLFSQCSRNV